MEEPLQIRLAKANINITDITEKHVLFEFPYHPRPGEVKWCKSYIERGEITFKHDDGEETRKLPLALLDIPDLVLEMRKALEA